MWFYSLVNSSRFIVWGWKDSTSKQNITFSVLCGLTQRAPAELKRSAVGQSSTCQHKSSYLRMPSLGRPASQMVLARKMRAYNENLKRRCLRDPSSHLSITLQNFGLSDFPWLRTGGSFVSEPPPLLTNNQVEDLVQLQMNTHTPRMCKSHLWNI